MSNYEVMERSDCSRTNPKRFAVVGPGGCLPLVPMRKEEAQSVCDMLNELLDPERESSPYGSSPTFRELKTRARK